MSLNALNELRFWLRDFADRRRVAAWSRAELEADHARRFHELVAFAAKHSAYFADVVNNRGLDPQTCELTDFPELTKATLNQEFDRIATEPALSRQRIGEFLQNSNDPTELMNDRFFVLRTSGTTGDPTYMAYSTREWIRGCSHRSRVVPGIQWRQRVAFYGVTHQHLAGVSLALTGRRGLNQLFFNCRTYDVNRPVSETVAQLNEFQPQVLSGYSNLLMILAQEQQQQRLNIRPKFVCSSGEVMTPFVRETLENTFQATVVNLYSTCETLFIGAASSSEGVMLFEDDILFEIFPTHVLVTNLFNRTIPLIRYRLDDVLIPLATEKSGPFRLLQQIAGRSTQPFDLVNNAGQLEKVSTFSMMYLPIPPVPGFQVVVAGTDQLLIRVKLEARVSTDERRKTLRTIESVVHDWLVGKHMDRSVSVIVEETAHLEIDAKSGKVKTIAFAPARAA
ncbi:MAG: hypothetical protein NT013_21475 [Planctomycetia bacterium]|nr:hypothetical protein [Planctomycetia bacterium]